MGLFSIVAAPLWYLVLVSFYRRPSRGIRGVLSPWFGGVLIGMAALLVTLGMLTRNAFDMHFDQLYRWAWIRGTGWALLPAGIIAAGCYCFQPTRYSRIRQIGGIFCGTATVYCIWYVLSRDPGFDAYRILFLPMVFLGAAAFAAVVLDRGLRMDGLLRYGVLCAAICLPSAFTFLPVLYAAGARIAAWIIALSVVISTPLIVFLDSRGRLR